jgi:hypothetical protein
MKINQPIYLVSLLLIFSYIFIFAPGDMTGNTNLILKMYSGKFRSVNPLIFSVFNLLGVWPMAYGVLVLEESKVQDFPVWPFILLSFIAGGFVYLIYFSLRKRSLEELPKISLQEKVEKRSNMYLLLAVGAILVLYGVLLGDYGGYLRSFQENNLVHVMTIDFVLLSILSPVLIMDDLHRKSSYNMRRLFFYSIFSIISVLIYLVRRSEYDPVTN